MNLGTFTGNNNIINQEGSAVHPQEDPKTNHLENEY